MTSENGGLEGCLDMTITVTPGDYTPHVIIRVFEGDELVYRRLINRDDEAAARAEIAKRFT